MDVVVGTDKHDLFATPRRPNSRQIVEPGRLSSELHRLAKAFDERAA